MYEWVEDIHEEDPNTGETLDYIRTSRGFFVPLDRHVELLHRYVNSLEEQKCLNIYITSLLTGLNNIVEELDVKDDEVGITDEEIDIWNQLSDVTKQARVDKEFCAIELFNRKEIT